MKKWIKLSAVLLGVIATVLMLFTQVTVKWATGAKDPVMFKALVGGTYSHLGTKFNAAGNGSGLAGYILVGAGALIILLTILVPLFKEHDVLSTVVTGIGVICIIVGTILIFLIRRSFANSNFLDSKAVYVGWAAIAAGSCASLAALFGGIGMVMDLSGNN